MSSTSCPLPVEILDLILLIILPRSSPGLVGLLLSVLPLLWSLLWLLDVVVVSVLNYLTPAPAALLQPVLGHLRKHLRKHLLGLRSGWGGPSLLANWIEV